MTQPVDDVAYGTIPQPRRRKWLYRTLWVLLVLIASPCIYWYWCRHVALAERDALIAEIHARGEPVWWNEVVERAEREQPEDNGAALFREALTAMEQTAANATPSLLQLRMGARVKDLFNELKPSAEIREAVRQSTTSFALLEDAVRRKPGLLTQNLRGYDVVAGPQYPLMANALIRMIQLRAYDAMVRNDVSDAYCAVVLQLRCAEQFGADPLLMALAAGWWTRSSACECLLDCLAYASPPEDSFRDLDALLAKHEDGFDIRHVFVGERARFLELIEHDDQLYAMLSSVGGSAHHFKDVERAMHSAWLRVVASPAGAPIRVRTQSDALRFTERFLPNTDGPDVDREGIGRALKEFNTGSPLAASLEDRPHLLYEWGWVSDRPLRLAHQRLIFTRLALRLRRHYDKHGRFPERLDELCDAAMPKIRIDWFQNHPIVYKPTAKGFRLEVPEASVPTWERELLVQKPLRTEYGLEFELKSR